MNLNRGGKYEIIELNLKYEIFEFNFEHKGLLYCSLKFADAAGVAVGKCDARLASLTERILKEQRGCEHAIMLP